MADMNPPKKAASKPTKEARNVSVKATPIFQRQLAELGKLWGENQSQTIFRAVAQAWEREFGKR